MLANKEKLPSQPAGKGAGANLYILRCTAMTRHRSRFGATASELNGLVDAEGLERVRAKRLLLLHPAARQRTRNRRDDPLDGAC